MKLSRCVRLVLVLLDRILKRLIPPQEGLICYLSMPDYSDNPFYMYRYLVQQRAGLKHVWLLNTPSQELIEKIRQDALTWPRCQLRFVAKASLLGYYLHLRASYTFYSHGLYGFSRSCYRRRIVCLWHGMPIKAIGLLQKGVSRTQLPFGSDYIASSVRFRGLLARAFDRPLEQIHICPQPRCDALRQSGSAAVSRAEVRKSLGYSLQQKLVVWLPTFRFSRREAALHGNDSACVSFLDDLSATILQGLKRRAEQDDIQVLIKLHPAETLGEGSYHRLDHPCLKILSAHEWASKKIQLYELLAASDGLLTDVSSVLIDYLICQRPIGILGFDQRAYSRDLLVSLSELTACENVWDCKDNVLLDQFFDALQQPVSPGGEDQRALEFNAASTLAGAECLAQKLSL